MSDIRDIVEVVETSRHRANLYLEHGYVLIGAEQCAKWQEKGEGGYVAKYVVYILGRPESVDHYEPAAAMANAGVAA